MDIRQQIEELQSKCKQLEQNKRAYAEESQKMISTQRIAIEKLKQENQHLQEVLNSDSKGASLLPTSQQQDRIDKLQDLVDTFTRKIELERRQLDEIEKELEVHQAKAEQTRKGIGGIQAAAEKQRNEAKTLKVLENRLEIAERKYNEALARNKELRAELDSLAKSKLVFDQAYQKLDKEVLVKKAEVAAIVEAINVATEAKSGALSEIATIKALDDREQKSFEAEMKEVLRCLEADERLFETQTKRMNKMAEAEKELNNPVLLESLDERECVHILQQLEEACGLALATPAGDDLASGEQQAEEAGTPGVEADPATSRSGTAAASSSSAERWQAVLQHCLQLEAANFGVFNECNTANSAIGVLQREIRGLQSEIRQLEADTPAGRQKDVVRSTIAKREAAERRTETLREKTASVERKLKMVRAGIVGVLGALDIIPVPPPLPAYGLDEGNLHPLLLEATSQAGGAAAASDAALLANMSLLEARARAVSTVYSTVMGKVSGVAGNASRPPSNAVKAGAPVAHAGNTHGAVHDKKPMSKSSTPLAGGASAGGARNKAKPHRPVSAELVKAGLENMIPSMVNDSSSEGSEDEAPLTRAQLQSKAGSFKESLKESLKG